MAMPPAYHESLPYIDPEPSNAALTAAHALITAEASTRPPKPLPPSPSPTFTPTLTTELTRIQASTPATPLALSRYEAQPTPSASTPSADLQTLLNNSQVSDAYLASRRQNLELLERYGKNSWLIGNHELEGELRGLERELADARKEVDLVNLERQRRQADVKGEMELLEENWRKGVGRVLETEVAVEEVKREIREELRRRGQGVAE